MIMAISIEWMNEYQNFDSRFLPNITEYNQLLIEGLKPLQPNDLIELSRYCLGVASNCLGLKSTDIPFNAHKDVMKRYILEIFSLTNESFYEEKVEKVTLIPAIKILVDRVTGLPPMDADGLCDPFIKIYKRGNSKKGFISKPMQNTLNPIFNEKIIIAIDPKFVNSNQEIIFEVWDKDPTNIYEIILDCFGIRKLRDFWNAIRDLSEWFVYLFYRINIDDKIGSTSFILNEIPATDLRLISILQDINGRSTGTISLLIGWGTIKEIKDNDKIITLIQHIKLIKHCLMWHCLNNNNINYRYMDTLSFINFLYIPGISLINQHRLQNNLSSYENDIIVCLVIINLLIESIDKDINWRIHLLAMLSNMHIDKLKIDWDSNEYKNILDQIYDQSSFKLINIYLQKIHVMLDEIIDKNNRLIVYHEFIQLLRLFSEYNRKYNQLNLRKKINNILSGYILEWLDKMFSDMNNWGTIVNTLERLIEQFRKYWLQDLYEILDEDGRKKIKYIFINKCGNIITNILEKWTLDVSSNAILFDEVYSFCLRLDKIIGSSRNFVLTHNDKVIKYSKRLKSVKSKTPSSPSIAANKDTKTSIKIRKKKYHWFHTRILNSSNKDEMTLKINRTKLNIKKNKEKQITIQNCQLDKLIFKTREHSNLDLFKIFTPEILEKWIKYCSSKSQNFIKSSFNNEFNLIVKKLKYNWENVDTFFNNTIGSTIYSFIQLNYYDKHLFDETLDICLNNLLQFSCHLYYGIVFEFYGSDNSSELILIRTLNCLSRIRDYYLRKSLIEILTNMKADKLWMTVYKFFDTKKIIYKSRYIKSETDIKIKEINDTKDLENTLNSLNLKMPIIQLIVICIKIDRLSDIILFFMDKIIDLLGKNFMIKYLKIIKHLIESDDKDMKIFKESLLNFISEFEENINNLFNLFNDYQIKINMFSYINYNFSINLNKYNLILKEYYDRELQDDKVIRYLTKIQIYKLSFICKKIDESLNKIKENLKSDDIDNSEFLDVDINLDFY